MNIACQHCGAELVIDDALSTTRCSFCDSPSVIERPGSEAKTRPSFALGFVQPEAEVRAHVARWLETRSLFCPGSLRHARVDGLQGIYIPAWLYSGVARSQYSARIGEDYTEVETYTERNEKGETVTRTRTVTKTEWRSLSGVHAANISDVLVTASRGLTNAELAALEPYDWRALRRYRPAVVSGWVAERPALTQEEGLHAARQKADLIIDRALSAFMPGDSHRGLEYSLHFEDEASDLVLVPVWVLNAYHDPEKPPLRVVVNGQTGAVHGEPPYSAGRIAFAVILSLAVIAILWSLVAAS